MGIELLPRTISIVRAGESHSELKGKATAEAAAFFRDACVPGRTPVAVMLDQTALPYAERYICTCDWKCVVEAIKSLEVRGAPAIGIAGAIAATLASAELSGGGSGAGSEDIGRIPERGDGDADAGEALRSRYIAMMGERCKAIADARPTAVNLQWAVDKMLASATSCFLEGLDLCEITDMLYMKARKMIADDETANRRIGDYGAGLLPDDATILTHCNAGSLATAFYGTALGVVYAAAGKGGIKRVFADETRPVGQGARLTVWELSQAGIPVTLICDDMSAYVMARGDVDAVVVGADRVAANGDTANKIGTLGVAIIAKRFGIPFYVACPTSTIDADTLSGEGITIEQRSQREVIERPLDGVDVMNPAFDVTPADLITAIITDEGVYAPEDIMRALEDRS